MFEICAMQGEGFYLACKTSWEEAIKDTKHPD